MSVMKVLLFAVIAALPLGISAAEFPNFPHIITTGLATQMVENDKANILVSVRSQSDSAERAQALSAMAINKITEVVKGDPATEKMQTVGVRTNPIFVHSPHVKPRIDGYESHAGLQVTANGELAALLHAKLGEVQSSWESEGITVTLTGPNFFLSQKKSEETEKELIASAYASALAQAQALAEASGLKIDKAVRLSTTQSHSAPQPFMERAMMPMAAMAMDSVAPISTQAGESQVGRTVEAVFSVQ